LIVTCSEYRVVQAFKHARVCKSLRAFSLDMSQGMLHFSGSFMFIALLCGLVEVAATEFQILQHADDEQAPQWQRRQLQEAAGSACPGVHKPVLQHQPYTLLCCISADKTCLACICWHVQSGTTHNSSIYLSETCVRRSSSAAIANCAALASVDWQPPMAHVFADLGIFAATRSPTCMVVSSNYIMSWGCNACGAAAASAIGAPTAVNMYSKSFHARFTASNAMQASLQRVVSGNGITLAVYGAIGHDGGLVGAGLLDFVSASFVTSGATGTTIKKIVLSGDSGGFLSTSTQLGCYVKLSDGSSIALNLVSVDSSASSGADRLFVCTFRNAASGRSLSGYINSVLKGTVGTSSTLPAGSVTQLLTMDNFKGSLSYVQLLDVAYDDAASANAYTVSTQDQAPTPCTAGESCNLDCDAALL
jgi:hypothetical protein